MTPPQYFTHAEGYAVLRPVGALRTMRAVTLITNALSYAADAGVFKLLVVLTQVTGLRPLRLAARYRIIHEWARVSKGMVRLSLVTNAEMIDPQRFGVTVAANAGMTANVFEDEHEALAWLLAPHERRHFKEPPTFLI